MSILKKSNYFRNIFWVGFIVWFVGSWIGGWHAVSQTTFERYTDTIGAALMLYGGFGDILRGVKIFKDNSTTINGAEVTVKRSKK